MPPKKGGKGKDGPAKFADKENLARAETEVLALQRLLELRSFEVCACYAELMACVVDAMRMGMTMVFLDPLLSQAIEARRSERLWRERNDAFSGALEQQREDTLDITSDMVRQYKAMQESMGKKVADLEAKNKELREKLSQRDELISKLQVRLLTGLTTVLKWLQIDSMIRHMVLPNHHDELMMLLKPSQSEQDAVRKGAEVEVLEMQRKMEDMQINFSQMLKDTLDQMHSRLASRMADS